MALSTGTAGAIEGGDGFRELALFAGIGGGILGGKLLGWRTVAAVETNPYCREVLLRRQRDGVLPLFPVWDDVRTFDGRPFRGVVDIVTAGFPCQPYSTAGRRRGEGDERNLWPDTVRVIREAGPEYALLENVPGLLAFDYFGEVLGSLADCGYDAEWDVVSAGSVGAPHLRRRLWILAWRCQPADSDGVRGEAGAYSAESRQGGIRLRRQDREAPEAAEGRQEREHGPGQTDWYSDGITAEAERPLRPGKGHEPRRDRDAAGADGESGRDESEDATDGRGGRGGDVPGSGSDDNAPWWWEAEPRVGRVADGVPARLDRLCSLGNAQVPLVAAVAFRVLAERAGLAVAGEESCSWADYLKRKGRL